ncbi:MAG: polysaccharide deacetylase family protein [Thaumarchaeota archaeon]|nr:polysaccharide deacetylase family protein [Nitrososphaerota archaeon]
MLKQNILLSIISCLVLLFIIIPNNAYGQESEIIELEIKYTNGDRADFRGMSIIVYQDFDKSSILEKKIESNPDFITLPENHRYKIEVYAYGMYVDVAYIQSESISKKLTITIPLSGGLQFEIFYKGGEIPIDKASVVLKSRDNSELGRGLTNDQGETIRFWINPTNKQEDYYIADIYLADLFLTSYFPINIQPGITTDLKITTNIPEIVEELISINLYIGTKKITSVDGDYKVTLSDLQGNDVVTSNVNFRGDAQFSNLKSGTYTVKISSDNEIEKYLWPQTDIHIIGDLNKFSVFKNYESIVKQDNPFQSCNCISFRLDDIQDFWLAETQVELINLFTEKNIPLTVGVIGSTIGSDERLISVLKDNLKKNNIEIANHSWNNDIITSLDIDTQEQYIIKTNDIIFEIFGIATKIFIPPENIYDYNTIKILKENGFTHLISHIKDNSITYIEDDLFYNVPATAETGDIKDKIQWQLRERDYINKKITQSLNQAGYAIIMIHPQEFSLNDEGEYGIPNQKSLSELSLLLDEILQLDAKIVKISEVKPSEKIIEEMPEIQEDIDSCNCVAFRLDGVQDYWLNEVQIKIMETFIENKTPLTIGIHANAFGNDPKITEFVKQNVGNERRYLEVATKGIELTPFTTYNKIEQNQNLKESLDLIESSVNVRPKVFIPPDNKFNSDTLEILEENNITHISSSLINGDSPPFDFEGKKFYRFPQITSTGKYNPSTNFFEAISSQQIISESIYAINNYGFSVISIQPQEFSIITNSTYVNSVNIQQIEELLKLIDGFNEKGYKIVPIGKINSNLIVLVPDWIKNNAGWWAEGSIDDETFVQGIEFLVRENIIKVSDKSQTRYNEQNIPSWIKNNAGWWAEGSIDNKTFVQGIEYLVKNGIITY